MQEHPKNDRQSKQRASLAVRLDRAAGDLNPFLLVLMIGLLTLNATLFVALAASRHQSASQLLMRLGTANAEGAADTAPTCHRAESLLSRPTTE
jgi:hypothetical protein